MDIFLLIVAGLTTIVFTDHIMKIRSRPVELRVPKELREHILRKKG